MINDIQKVLKRLGGFGSIHIPEFTYGDLRIDALVVDTRTRWIRGFEIKMSRSDFQRDEKYHLYSKFCSSLSIVCPKGLIDKKEVPDPFGLLYIDNEAENCHGLRGTWAKRPKRFQRRDGLAWIWTYVTVLEKELPRLQFEIERIKHRG